ncbi:MAG: hypothetical protein CVV11_19980 [Gammaproteobacteria bacterium HGW-Gammaproteobacteria-15]|nr:MAG: hypothetical protein CVV11_19980 [Gammaproteobacteria bacterium HGW-Gammaproteobacteria-15]
MELLEYLDRAITITALVALCLSLLTINKLPSVFFAGCGFLLVQLTSYFMIVFVRDLGKFVPEHADLVRVVWYFGFAFFNLLYVVVIYRIHRAMQARFDFGARFICSSMFCLAIIQVLRFTDRHLEINVLGEFYKYSIPAINVACVTVLVGGLVLASLSTRGFTGVRELR